MKKIVKFTVLAEMDKSQDEGGMQELVADTLFEAGLDVNYVSSIELDDEGDEIIKR
ncbi:MAG: hypothetical protein KTR16_11415 [Acidiferrobacterales bacterium]|nr:hypothetical protein [Acidiferrobacterales bacterium]